jgi:hypothetical protein
VRLLVILSWLGGAASPLPFVEEWLDLSQRAGNLLLLGAIASSVALGLAVHGLPRLRALVLRLAGPPDQPAHALALVAVFASAGALTMLAAAALAARA